MPRSPRQPPDGELEALLDRAAAAFDAGELDQVLVLADEALRRDPRSPEALHFRAAALTDEGKLDEAEEVYRRAVEVAPDDPELLLGFADLLIAVRGDERDNLTRGLELAAKGRKLARKRGLEALVFELALLEGMGLNQLGECVTAVQRLDEALAIDPDSTEAHLERGIATFELCRFDEAKKDLQAALDADAEDAWAHHYLGLIAEREGDVKETRRRFARATELAPDDFPAPVKLSEAEFDRAVEDAIEKLPEQVKQYLENTTIAVEPIPNDEDLISSEPPLSPAILGVFRGTPVGERSVSSAADHFPASIVLYQRNLERFARSRAELIEQIGITLMHEVGHLIGLDEEDLWERGLD